MRHIQSISGHRTLAALARYLDVTDEQSSERDRRSQLLMASPLPATNMQYRHILTRGEITTGRLNVGGNSLDSESRTWFEKHSGVRVAVYSLDGSLIKRSVIIDQYKRSSWRFCCGIDTVQQLQPGNAIIIKNRPDDNLEIEIGQQFRSEGRQNPDTTLSTVGTDQSTQKMDARPVEEVAQQSPELPTLLQPSFEPYISTSTYIPSRRRKQPLLGEPLNFRGLQHAPINEQGVVFLFGMVCRELGYLIEAVQTGFPDCEAKRRVDNQRWQRVRIEFEFKSSKFLEHGHDAELCDLIVCWEHDWRNCPLEVLELRKEIQNLNNNL